MRHGLPFNSGATRNHLSRLEDNRARVGTEQQPNPNSITRAEVQKRRTKAKAARRARRQARR